MTSPIAVAKAKHISRGFTEIVERGKGRLRSRKPGTNQYALTTQVGNRGWHFGAGPYTEAHEVDTAWVASGGAWDYEMTKADFYAYVRESVPVSYRYEEPVTAHYVELTVNAIEWVNDEDQSEDAASFSQVTPTIDDDQITWSDIATGWTVRVEAQTARLVKWLDIDSLTNLGSPTIGGTNIRLRFSFTFQKSSGLEIWADGVQWGEKNNTWAETVNHIEFRDSSTQQPVFYFNRPGAVDSGASQATVTQRTRRTGANFYAEVDVPWSWLQIADYPISIDPTIEPQVGASADNWYHDASTFTNGVFGWNIGDPFSDQPAGVGFRVAISGPTGGETVDVAYIEWVARAGRTDDITFDMYAWDANDPNAPSNRAEAVGYTPTTASVNQTFTTNTSTGVTYQFAEIKTIIQELWDSGYGLNGEHINMTCEVTASTAGNYQQAKGYDESSSEAPLLHIEYSAVAARRIFITHV